MSRKVETHKSHRMSEEIDPDRTEPHLFCLNCLLCNCHDQKHLNKPCKFENEVRNVKA